MLRLGALLEKTRAEGPGLRSALWVQGCSIQCNGCFNPQFFSKVGGKDWVVSDLADHLNLPDTEGLTILGGEPLDQAEALGELTEILKSWGKTVLTFTGHPSSKVLTKPEKSWEKLLHNTDLLIAGPYLHHQQNFRRYMIGSSNQTSHPLSPIGLELEKRMVKENNRVEVRLAPSGEVFMNGQGNLVNSIVGRMT